MRFFSISTEIQQRLAIAVPLIALLISLFLVYPAWGRNTTLSKQVETQRKQLQDLKATPLPVPGPVALSEAAVPSEPPRFLGQIRVIAANAHCDLTGYTAGAKADPKPDEKVQAVRAKVELTARYQDIRNFLYQLSQAPRVYVVTDVSLDRAIATSTQPVLSGRVRASIEIERFVTPVVKP